ncbi:MAG: peptidylprolyl isomerase [Bacteroidales bacterium]|jgi:peptidyl-prolyl cis-trans isomerase SurA|nr:peptidylprolyl isomerase [Bacteroidales bacterium]
MKKTIITLLAILFVVAIFAQEKALLEIDDEKIYADEFLHIYRKNNTDANAMNYDALKDYMDLFCNFKLKVHEAVELGLDTSSSFKNELYGYRSQLAQPYLNDQKIEEDIVKEAYDRMQYDVEVSHILIKLPKNLTPEDTLKAYEKINEVYEKLKKGEDFEKLAEEYSEDESVVVNGGNIGYRTVFGLVYEFETEMYNTPVGKFSKPFRTGYGYHVLKVTDKRPAKGKYKVAHIMKVVPPGLSSGSVKEIKDKIIKIEERLKNGEDFAKVAEEVSDDRKTAAKGGELGWISVGGRMIKEFEEATFKLNNVGDISPIIETGYGYHIIKLLEIEPIKPFDEIKNNIKSQITNTARTSKSREAVLARLKEEYNLITYPENVSDFTKYVTDSIFEGTWKIEENIDLTKVVLTFNNLSYTQNDFYNYIIKFNRKQPVQDITMYVNNAFGNFANKMLIGYEEEILEDKYPDFKYLLKEYHDGILLFELTDKMVWTKAVKDTTGLASFHNENKNNYMWNYRYDVKVYKTKDNKTANALAKSLNKGQNSEIILAKLNKKDPENVILEESYLNEKNVTLKVDQLIRENSIPEKENYSQTIIDPENNNVTLIKVIGPQPKTLNEARGIITADYQNYLEKEWIKYLREKYKIIVHDDVLRQIAR